MSPYEIYQRELTIRRCLSRRQSFDPAMRWLPTLDLDSIITHVFPLTDPMDHARQGKDGKVLVAP